MLNCEGEVARLYKGRFEEITKVTSGMDSETKTLTLALKDRLDREVSASGSKEATISELRDEGKLILTKGTRISFSKNYPNRKELIKNQIGK